MLFIKICLLNISLVVICLFQLSCKKFDEKYIVELGRIASPDSVVDAIIMEDRGGGATSRITTLIYIIPVGEKVNDFDTYRFTATKVDSISIRWIQQGILEIHYKKAEISNFRNIWYSRQVANFHYVVELRLIKDGKEKIDPWSEIHAPFP